VKLTPVQHWPHSIFKGDQAMVKNSLSECLSLLNEQISTHMKVLDDYSRIDYHLKYLSLLYNKTKYSTQKMLCELIGLMERILDQLETGERKDNKE
jgi:hypothetical protein